MRLRPLLDHDLKGSVGVGPRVSLNRAADRVLLLQGTLHRHQQRVSAPTMRSSAQDHESCSEQCDTTSTWCRLPTALNETRERIRRGSSELRSEGMRSEGRMRVDPLIKGIAGAADVQAAIVGAGRPQGSSLDRLAVPPGWCPRRQPGYRGRRRDTEGVLCLTSKASTLAPATTSSTPGASWVPMDAPAVGTDMPVVTVSVTAMPRLPPHARALIV